MAGYTRQSVADIIASAIIKAGPVNAEYNALRDAFAFSGGHKHDGSSTEGAYVPLIADVDAKNKVVVDTTNNRISFYSEVGGAAVEQVRIKDGAIVPVTDDDIDLGAVGAEFKNLYVDGVGYIDTLTVHENATIAGTLGVTGVLTATGGVVGDVTGNVTGDITGDVTGDLTGDVTSTGTSTFATVDVNGGTIDGTTIGATTPAAATFSSATATTVDINGGTIDATVIGGTTPAAADFTTMDATGNASVGGTFNVTGTSTFTGAMSAGSLTTTGNSTHATVDINGGAIDGAIIGASSAAAGSFTTVSTSGQATLATADINGGTIDGSVIGGATPQAVTGTTITANTGFTGALTGNVTGNVTGNLTGNVTGDVTGDLTGNVTAATGTTTLNDLIVNGTVDFTSTALLNVSDPTADQHAATKIYTDTADALKLNLAGGTMSGDITMGGNTVTGLGTPSASSDAATKGYVDTEVAALVDAAPGTLDTLNELAAALGDDPDFATTITDSIATKLPLAGGTMTGDVTLGANKATSTATPATDDTLTRKGYVDDQDDLKLNLSGGTMSGAIAMGTSKVTGLGDPTANQDAATKAYTDTQDATKLNLSGGTMTGNIVLGSNKATSTATPTANDDLTRKGYVDGILGSATAAADSAAAAATSASEAATSASNAATSEANAEAVYDNFDDRYLGDKASAPTVDNDGDALAVGALYFNTSGGAMYVWNGSSWQGVSPDLVGDTTPQLGGDLDSNGNDILFGDNDKAIFGAGSDLQIYHDGSNSYIKDDGTGDLRIWADSPNIATASGNKIFYGNNGSAELYTSGGTLRLATTSTGVDIKNVASGANAKLNITTESTGGGTSEILFSDNTTGRGRIYYDHGSSPEELHIETTGTDAIVIDNSQNVTIPNGNLDVTGEITADGLTVDGSGTAQITSTSGTTLELIRSGSAGQISSLIMKDGGNAQNRINSSGGALEFEYGASNLNALKIANNGDISFYEDSGTTPKFFWDASAERLGIGTSSPDYELHVADTDSFAVVAIEAANNSFSHIFFGDTDDIDIGRISYSHADDSMLFRTNNSGAMWIDSSGNVGIGTDSPSSAIDVRGESVFGSGTDGVKLTYSAGNSTGIIDTGFTSTGLEFRTGNSFAAIIDSSGNVGIGSSTANHFSITGTANVLGVKSSSGALVSIAATGTNFSGIDLGTDSLRRAGMYSLDGSVLGFYTNPTNSGTGLSEAMRIDSSGNVKIGDASTDVTSKLTVSGNGNANVATFMYDGTLGTYLDIDCNAANGSVTLSADARSGAYPPLTFKTGGSEAMRIDSSGTLVLKGPDDNSLQFYESGSEMARIGPNGGALRFLVGSTTTPSMTIDSSGNLHVGTTQEANTALSGTTPSIDADTAGSFTLTTSGNTTFTFASVTSGRSVGFVLKLTAGGGHTITWPSSVDWAGGTAPDAPASGETDVLVFYTVDGGTNWYGVLSIDAAA